jgi:hypothetical protein
MRTINIFRFKNRSILNLICSSIQLFRYLMWVANPQARKAGIGLHTGYAHEIPPSDIVANSQARKGGIGLHIGYTHEIPPSDIVANSQARKAGIGLHTGYIPPSILLNHTKNKKKPIAQRSYLLNTQHFKTFRFLAIHCLDDQHSFRQFFIQNNVLIGVK